MGYRFRNGFVCIGAALFSNCKLLNPEIIIIINTKELGGEISEWWSEKYDNSYGTKIVITLKKMKKRKDQAPLINFDLHFSYPIKINTNEVFSYLKKIISCKRLFKIYIIYQKYDSERVPQKENLLIYTYSKSHCIPCFFVSEINQNMLQWHPGWTIYAPHFSSLQAVSKMHCLYANAVVQPSVQHCPCYMVWKTKVHTWCRHCHLCINAPMWRGKKHGCKDFLTLPHMLSYY